MTEYLLLSYEPLLTVNNIVRIQYFRLVRIQYKNTT